MKRAEAAKPTPIQPVAVTAQAQPISGTGSVWNTNSYHWEEKNVNTWATETLKNVLSTFTHEMDKSNLTITDVTTVTGESSVSIRKGKKLVTFDYQIELKWKL